MDLTAILENKWPIAGVLAAIIGAMSAWPHLGKLAKWLPVNAAPVDDSPTIDDAFTAVETLALYAKATSNAKLSKSAINAFEDVATVDEVAP